VTKGGEFLSAILFVFFIFCLCFARHGSAASFLHAPHNEAHNIPCASCHADLLPDIDRSAVCETCHGPGGSAPLALTHSNAVIHGSQTPPYAGLSFSCLDCHDPHFHVQLVNMPNLYLVTGNIDPGSITNNGNNTSTFSYSGAVVKDGWNLPPHVDNADWGAKTSAGRGLILVTDKNNPGATFEVVSANSSQLTVNGVMSSSLAGNDFGLMYGQFVKDAVDPDGDGAMAAVAVKFYDHEAANSFADGDTTYDGICEGCHTQTDHFRNDGSAVEVSETPGDGLMEHTAATNCTSCHTHASGFGFGGGSDCGACHADWGAHPAHVEAEYGPKLACYDCHDTNDYPNFISGTGTAPYDLSETDVCNPCHSAGGSYNGVTSVGDSVGAKDNWTAGVYDSAMNLQVGKEKWCVGCHDDSPSQINGVSAPNVAGDGSSYGFYVTGHKISCLLCHDATQTHADGNARTYTAAADNYQAGYRLKAVDGQAPLDIPRSGAPSADQFRLCFICHSSEPFLSMGNTDTNFRKDVNDDCSPANPNDMNKHWYHLQAVGALNNVWDSDWDGATGDSLPSCPTCHNVHGAKTKAGATHAPGMVRTGELIGRSSALNLEYFINPCNDQTFSATNETASSTGGVLTGGGGRTIVSNGVCNMCHNVYSPYWRQAKDLVGSCTGCHSIAQDNGDGVPVGGRRAVVGEFPVGSSHAHYGAELDDDACVVCHDQTTHMDGYVDLRDADGGANYRFVEAEDLTSDPDVSNFCANCHDADGAAGLATPTDPFGNGNAPPDVARLFQGTLQWNEYYGDGCFGYEGSNRPGNSHHDINDADQAFSGAKLECLNCHGVHTAAASQPIADPFDTQTAWSGSINGFCLACHDGGSSPVDPGFPTGVQGPVSSRSQTPGASCGEGMVYDCADKCVVEADAMSAIGDNFCDDGYADFDLRCAAFSNDGGDCGPVVLEDNYSLLSGIDTCDYYVQNPWFVDATWTNSAHGLDSKRDWPEYVQTPQAPAYELDCVACHDPHGSYTDTNTAGNPYMIRDSVDGTGFVDDGVRGDLWGGPPWTYGSAGPVTVPVSGDGPDMTSLCSKCHANWQNAEAFYHQYCTSCVSCHAHGAAFGENDWGGGGNVIWCPY